MIILNDKRFNNEEFKLIKTKEEISNTNKIPLFIFKEYDLDLYNYCKNNKIEYAVEVNTIKDFIFISNLEAKYAICSNLELAKNLQKIADNYLIETKVILKSSINEIEKLALLGIDGIFVI